MYVKQITPEQLQYVRNSQRRRNTVLVYRKLLLLKITWRLWSKYSNKNCTALGKLLKN